MPYGINRLVAGLARSEEKDHPFPAALRALAARGDALSEYAGKLSAQVEAALPPRPATAARGAPRT